MLLLWGKKVFGKQCPWARSLVGCVCKENALCAKYINKDKVWAHFTPLKMLGERSEPLCKAWVSPIKFKPTSKMNCCIRTKQRRNTLVSCFAMPWGCGKPRLIFRDARQKQWVFYDRVRGEKPKRDDHSSLTSSHGSRACLPFYGCGAEMFFSLLILIYCYILTLRCKITYLFSNNQRIIRI